MSRKYVTVALALAVNAGALSCRDAGDGFEGEIEFEGEQPFLPGFEHDSGWVPADAPASIRVVAQAGGGVVARARATTDGSGLTPVAGSGELTSNGELVLELHARVDTSGLSYEGVVESFTYAIDPATTTFEPFLLEDEAQVKSELPESELARAPIPSLPGATLIVDVTGGSITTTFDGVCAEAADGVGQYTGRTTTTGTVELGGSIEIEVPIVGTETFGPFPLTVDIPELRSEIDLGARSLQTAEPVDDPLPCAAMTGDTDDDPSSDSSASDTDASPPDDATGGDTGDDTGGVTDGDTGDDGSESGTMATATGRDIGSTDMGACGPTPCWTDADCSMGLVCEGCTCV